MTNDPARTVPLCYQVLEPEQIDTRQDRPATNGLNKIVRGIELDRFNRPVAYYIYDAHPYDQWSGWSGAATRVPASRIIHQYLPFRPSQTRGISWLAAIMQPSRDVDWYLTNELTSAAIGALLTLIVKRATPNRGGMGLIDDQESQDEFGNELLKLGRANVAELGKDDDIKVAESGRPNRNAGDFIKLMMEQAGMAAGVSYIRLTNDLKAASYTSARASHLNDAAFFRPIQNWLSRKTMMPVRRRHTSAAVAKGLLSSISAQQFLKQQRRWTRLMAMGPGREQLDPEMETDAALGRIRGGMSSLPEENALMGRNWRRTIQQRARSERYAASLGVVLDFSKGASPPAGEKKRESASGEEVQSGAAA
jgi:lambda family phage portal protein